ncbi:MAG: hypothetical protein FJZ00_00195 [Candidatus Sericytochromatia bacterium]|uniref:Uncharacterized protein n=1 Tax=Candidatus Tanganyikabacteria bacterium TaxID=2961651 RepID=A0A937X3J8_9BACT|nr:hypothetical protein [Candidatus Tanganyikabacteria bacterium]
MLFKAVLIVQVPGKDRADAEARIKERLGGWGYLTATLDPSVQQPPDVAGTADIKLPLPRYVNGR